MNSSVYRITYILLFLNRTPIVLCLVEGMRGRAKRLYATTMRTRGWNVRIAANVIVTPANVIVGLRLRVWPANAPAVSM